MSSYYWDQFLRDCSRFLQIQSHIDDDESTIKILMLKIAYTLTNYLLLLIFTKENFKEKNRHELQFYIHIRVNIMYEPINDFTDTCRYDTYNCLKCQCPTITCELPAEVFTTHYLHVSYTRNFCSMYISRSRIFVFKIHG